MPFLHGKELKRTITALMDQRPLDCAVAFWGEGAQGLLMDRPDEVRVICSLTTGGTNPRVIRALKAARVNVKQLTRLHAKVYLAPETFVTCSANASAAGLGFDEGQAGHEEAGFLSEDPEARAEAQRWFNTLWEEHCRGIRDHDLDEAEAIWDRREQLLQPITGRTFGDFLQERTRPLKWLQDNCLMEWCGTDEMRPAEGVRRALPEASNDELQDRIGDAIEWKAKADSDALKAGRWVLRYYLDRKGEVRAGRGNDPFWSRVESGKAIRQGARYATREETQTIILTEPRLQGRTPGEPFDVGENRFVGALREVLSAGRLKELKDEGFEGAWFSPGRRELMRDAWVQLVAAYQP